MCYLTNGKKFYEIIKLPLDKPSVSKKELDSLIDTIQYLKSIERGFNAYHGGSYSEKDLINMREFTSVAPCFDIEKLTNDLVQNFGENYKIYFGKLAHTYLNEHNKNFDKIEF